MGGRIPLYFGIQGTYFVGQKKNRHPGTDRINEAQSISNNIVQPRHNYDSIRVHMPRWSSSPRESRREATTIMSTTISHKYSSLYSEVYPRTHISVLKIYTYYCKNVLIYKEKSGSNASWEYQGMFPHLPKQTQRGLQENITQNRANSIQLKLGSKKTSKTF